MISLFALNVAGFRPARIDPAGFQLQQLQKFEFR